MKKFAKKFPVMSGLVHDARTCRVGKGGKFDIPGLVVSLPAVASVTEFEFRFCPCYHQNKP